MIVEVRFVCPSEELREVAERVGNQVGWMLGVGIVLPFTDSVTLGSKLDELLMSASAVCVVGKHKNEPKMGELSSIVRKSAGVSDCDYWTFDQDSREILQVGAVDVEKSLTHRRVVIVIPESMDTVDVALAVGLLQESIFASPVERSVPFKDLYALNFNQVNLEANWTNSRMMWFMFANSAFVSLFAASGNGSVAAPYRGIAVTFGVILSGVVLALQWLTQRAENHAIDKCNNVVADWKKAVPQNAKYISDTPAGGDDNIRHTIAQWLMLAITILMGCLWIRLWLRS